MRSWWSLQHIINAKCFLSCIYRVGCRNPGSIATATIGRSALDQTKDTSNSLLSSLDTRAANHSKSQNQVQPGELVVWQFLVSVNFSLIKQRRAEKETLFSSSDIQRFVHLQTLSHFTDFTITPRSVLGRNLEDDPMPAFVAGGKSPEAAMVVHPPVARWSRQSKENRDEKNLHLQRGESNSEWEGFGPSTSNFDPKLR